MLQDRMRTVDENAVDILLEKAHQLVHPLKTRKDLALLLEWIGNAHFVLLGEASHGTSEFVKHQYNI